MNASVRLCGLTVVFLVFGACHTRADEPGKTDKDLLQGTWVCTQTLKEGEKVETYVGVRAEFKGDELTWHYPKKDGTFATEKCKYRIDEEKQHFDWWRPAKPESVEVRFYSVTETELRMATNLDYKTRPEAIDQGKWQFTCQRVSTESAKNAPRGKTIKGWGEIVDPAGDCGIAEVEGGLTITVPGSYHDFTPEADYNNLDAPRIVQEVEGDFEMQVLVRKFPRPLANTGANTTKPLPYVSSGLVVWQEGGKFVRLERASAHPTFLAAVGSWFSGQKKVARGRNTLQDESVWLRLKRKGGKLSLFHSAGKTWTPVVPAGEEFLLPGKVKVGVFTINATNREIRHQFEGFTLERAPMAK